jgi:hypothetical protein
LPFIVDFDFHFQRNRAAIQVWLERLAEAKDASENLDNEAAAWFRSLPPDQKSRLESDLARLTIDPDETETIARGPLGELIGRFSRLIPGSLPDQNDRSDRDQSPASEIDEIAAELGKLGEIDPSWSADWEAFQESVEAPELPDDRGTEPDR